MLFSFRIKGNYLIAKGLTGFKNLSGLTGLNFILGTAFKTQQLLKNTHRRVIFYCFHV
jgi:hypothetical protein